MQINNLKLKNYRNHTDLSIELAPRTTLIVGPNGIGKTNILEAIYLLSTVKSPRAKYDRDLIQHGKDFCTINANTIKEDDQNDLEIQILATKEYEHSSTKRVKINKVGKAHKQFNKMFNAVLFTPEDIRILTGSPAGRRKYMDITLGQLDYTYKKNHSDYIKAVRQRNKLLETISETGRGHNQLEYWNTKILETGSYLQEKRQELFDFLKVAVRDKGTDILKNGNDLQINYKKSELSESRMEEYAQKELWARNTLIGPHKDDFNVTLDGFDIANFGSRGQQRSALLALKLSEIEFVEKIAGERPVLLLDDIFSELDDMHKQSVSNVIAEQQTIITSTEIVAGQTKEKPLIIDLTTK
jgi:DNA replication and repair protein RecF